VDGVGADEPLNLFISPDDGKQHERFFGVPFLDGRQDYVLSRRVSLTAAAISAMNLLAIPP